MASEAVEMIISADDQASKKFAEVAANAEQSVKKIKDTTKATKSTAEFAGVLGNLLGGSELGQIASQIGQISEKTSQFSEVSAKGGIGALAFRGGLVAMAGALAFEVGRSLGNVIFQVDEFNKKAEEARQKSQELASKILESNRNLLTEKMQDIELIRDPARKQEAYKALTDSLNDGIGRTEDSMKRLRKEIEGLSTWQGWLNDARSDELEYLGNLEDERAQDLKARQAELEQEKAKRELFVQQREAIAELTNERAKDMEAIKKRNSELDKEDSYIAGLEKQLDLLEARNKSQDEFNAATAAQNAITDEGRAKAEALLANIEKQNQLAEEKRNADAEAKKAKDDEIRQQEAIDALFDRELDALEIRREAFEKGAEAAKKMALIYEGLSPQVAGRIAAEESALDAEIKAADEKKQREEALSELRKKTLADLEQQKILIEQGEEAARSFALQQEGLGKAESDRIAAEEKALKDREKEKELQKKLAQGPGDLNAVESRLLVRGGGTNSMLQIAKEQLATQKRQTELLEQQKNDRPLRIRRVGAGV
jgi:hypothetical protein